MKIIVLDITARNAVQYNPSLCEGLCAVSPNSSITLVSTALQGGPKGYTFKKLPTLVPKKMTSSEGKIKRLLRALELVYNYLYMAFYIWQKKPDILHIQWLPIVEFASGEAFFLKLYKRLVRGLKIAYTAHNIYPHNCIGKDKDEYRDRFVKVIGHIDAFLVHLKSSKETFCSEFHVPAEKVFVAYHGIYRPTFVSDTDLKVPRDKKRIIMYGYQNKYKGTDLLVEAIATLPELYKRKLETSIVGKSDQELYDTYKERCESLNISWINEFVSDEELYRRINDSDLIILPYREISQSGVLLLALSYNKPILTSDLPSFKETLEGYPENYFFASNDSKSLSEMITRYLDNGLDIETIKKVIRGLNDKYSWKETANATLVAYNSVIYG